MLYKVKVKDEFTGNVRELEVEASSKEEAHRLARKYGQDTARLEEAARAELELAQYESLMAARKAEETRLVEEPRLAEEARQAEAGRQADKKRRDEAAFQIAATQLAVADRKAAAKLAEFRKAEAEQQVAGAASNEVAANVLQYAEIVQFFGVITIVLSVIGGIIFVASAKGETIGVITGLSLAMGGWVCGVGYLTAAAVLRLLVGLKADTRQLCNHQVARLEQNRPDTKA